MGSKDNGGNSKWLPMHSVNHTLHNENSSTKLLDDRARASALDACIKGLGGVCILKRGWKPPHPPLPHPMCISYLAIPESILDNKLVNISQVFVSFVSHFSKLLNWNQWEPSPTAEQKWVTWELQYWWQNLKWGSLVGLRPEPRSLS